MCAFHTRRRWGVGDGGGDGAGDGGGDGGSGSGGGDGSTGSGVGVGCSGGGGGDSGGGNGSDGGGGGDSNGNPHYAMVGQHKEWGWTVCAYVDGSMLRSSASHACSARARGFIHLSVWPHILTLHVCLLCFRGMM